jgi:MoaA/NifB/PqqE/SkfB family radical SAM enzyme
MVNKCSLHPTDASIILTYRCPMKCKMCNIWFNPTNKSEEIKASDLKSLPKLKFINLTGGEPFIREDLPEIVEECYKHTDRIVISTSGWFEDRVIALAKQFPIIGIRISIEGLSCKNDELRGHAGGFDKGLRTLLALKEMGLKDIGFGCTVSNNNSKDMLSLYQLSKSLGMEFATASLHNSFYFVEAKNIIKDRPMVAKNFEKLVNELLKSNSPKKWFRAYFNHGLINYIYGQKRLLPCDMSFDTFFIDPYGDVMPCNGTKDKEVMGNLNLQTWDELWNSPDADKVRAKVRCCDRDCWMIGSVSPAMHKYIWKPASWVIYHKIKAIFSKKPYSMYELKICREYRDGKVSKEDLDKCSTCDMNCKINNGLSQESMEQLKYKTGEQIVDEDIESQMKGTK